MIEVANLTKGYGGEPVLRGLSMRVEQGSLHALVGVNGSGKTTLLHTIAGLYRPDRGAVRFEGKDVFDNALYKASMGFVASGNILPSGMPVEAVARWYAGAYESFSTAKWQALLERSRLPAARSVRNLSRGMQMLLSLLLCLAAQPKLLLMDEPFAGLDPSMRRRILNLLIEDSAERGTTMLISSHDLADLERVCDTVSFLRDGKIGMGGSLAELKQGMRRVQAVFEGEIPMLRRWAGVRHVEITGRVARIVTDDYTPELALRLKNAGASHVEEIGLTLEEIFIYTDDGETGGL